MKIIRDRKGGEWHLEITVGTVRQLRKPVEKGGLDFDLNTLLASLLNEEEKGGGALVELFADPVKLIDVVYLICKEEADDRGITDEHFGRLFAGDALEGAGKGLVEELVFFSPNPEVRATLQAMIQKMEQLHSRLTDRAQRELAEIDIDQLTESVITRLKDSFGKVRQSLDLTPIPQRSVDILSDN